MAFPEHNAHQYPVTFSGRTYRHIVLGIFEDKGRAPGDHCVRAHVSADFCQLDVRNMLLYEKLHRDQIFEEGLL